MSHTYYFYAEDPVTRHRLFKRTYTAPFVTMAYEALRANLERKGLRIEDYKWCVGRSDKTRAWRKLRRSGMSISDIWAAGRASEFTHPGFDGTDSHEGTLNWLARVEREDWK